jgi:surface carbohydrate biosynthesis protein
MIKKVFYKIKKISAWAFRVKIKFNLLENADIVIFEDTNTDYLLPLCDNYSYEVIDIELNYLYLNFPIVLNTLLNILSFNPFKPSYCAALIKQIKPKVLITFIDNSILFYSVSKILHKEIFILAIQNASRYDTLELPDSKSKKIFIPNFACFGQNEVDIYTKKNTNVGNFFPLGSLRDSYYRDYKSHNKSTYSKDYDICIVAEASPRWDDKYPGYEDAVGKIAQYALRYSEEKKLSIVIAGKRDIGNELELFQTTDTETSWYKKYIGDSLKITPRIRNKFTTYDLIDRSRISLAFVSTALSEGVSRGNRVLFCNFSKHSVFNFPVNGLMSLTTDNYEEFSSRVTKILGYTDFEYNDKVSSASKYIMNTNDLISTSNALKEIISQAIQNKKVSNVK